MRRWRLHGLWLLPAVLLALVSLPALVAPGGPSPVSAPALAAEQVALSRPADQPPPPPRKTVGQVLASGVVITVSLKSQQMHVFRDGVLWRSSPVSTGKRGKRTPTGVFAILQKKRFHRSNLYSNAPMPWMQRLTWSGIAIHAGRLPGYPASHGCIRVPAGFASELFKITEMASTAVIIVDEPLASEAEALKVASASDAAVPISPALLQREAAALARKADDAGVRPPAARIIAAPQIAAGTRPPAPSGGGQTIQLAAMLSTELARAHWQDLSATRPELRGMEMAVVPAVVNGTRYYRLRASAPDAHARCRALKRAGIACFPVV